MVKVTERKLGREHAAGQAWIDRKHIEIDPRQKPRDWFYTLVHEAIHLAFKEIENLEIIDEEDIIRAEKVIGDAMWKAGVRRVHVK